MEEDKEVLGQTITLCETFKETVLLLTEKNQKFAYRVIFLLVFVIIAILGFFLTLYIMN